jgi:raffinose/stachyose/melibiose transport system permease protein
MTVKKVGTQLMKSVVNIIILLFSISCIFPLLWMFNSSFMNDDKFLTNNLRLAIPPLYQNYVQAVFSGKLLNAFLFSGYLSILNVICVLIFSTIIGYLVSRYDFLFKNIIYLLFVVGMVVPTLSLLVPVFIQFKAFGLYNQRFTLLLPYIAFSMPFAVIVTENYIRAIPRELDEAAHMEGCGLFRLLTKIIFPMCLPIASIVVITSFIYSWNEFPFSLVLVNEDYFRTISVSMRMFNTEHEVKYTLYIAALFSTIIPILIIYSIFSKNIMKGMTVGAVKG